MTYKRLIPCIFLSKGTAVKWFTDQEILAEDPIALAKSYSDQGADELIVLDLSNTDEEQEKNLDLVRKINRVIRIPLIVGGNIRREDDIKKIIYTGAKRAIVNCSKPESDQLIQKAAERFGKEKIAVSLNDFDALFKHNRVVKEYASEIVFMHRLDLNSVMNITDLPSVMITDTMEESEIFRILKCPGIRGISGKFISRPGIDYTAYKELCEEQGISMATFESMMEFSQFKVNDQGLLPVVVQHYKTDEVLMVAYMNEEAFEHTIRTGRMTYFSRSRQKLWVKGETSGHFQYVKSLTIDCDCDTLLAKVDQIGAACHTGNPTCFFTPIAGDDADAKDTRSTFDTMLAAMKEQMLINYPNPTEKDIDRMLKKMSEEVTELIIATKTGEKSEIAHELSDVLHYSMQLMSVKAISLDEIFNELLKH